MKMLLVFLVAVSCAKKEGMVFEKGERGTLKIAEGQSSVTCTLGRKYENKEAETKYDRIGSSYIIPAHNTFEDSKPTLDCKGSPTLTVGCIELCNKLLIKE